MVFLEPDRTQASSTVPHIQLPGSYQDFLQFGEQPQVEKALDEACSRYKRAAALISSRTLEEVAREFPEEFGAMATLKHPDKTRIAS